jgi:hypothetical protein
VDGSERGGSGLPAARDRKAADEASRPNRRRVRICGGPTHLEAERKSKGEGLVYACRRPPQFPLRPYSREENGLQERRGAVGPLPSVIARADRDYRNFRTKAAPTSARASRPSIGKESVGTAAVTTEGVGVLVGVAVGVGVGPPRQVAS